MYSGHSFLVAFLVAVLFRVVRAQDKSDLEGTWTTKSNAVLTGPDFYDPVNELLIEPALPGISLSFTTDGWFEEAIYQVVPNPQQIDCPSAVMIFQHGTYELLNNGSLILNPIKVDGRQLLSDPCNDDGVSTYDRYNQTEFYQGFNVELDGYWGRYRLDLYKFDGSPMAPMYLAYKPPQMLPTQTMNPTESGAKSTSSTSEKVKRYLENKPKTTAVKRGTWDYNAIWWFGMSMICVGATGWLLI
ncbi:protein Rot1p [Trichomonascus vanleenenianus]|uniref:Rot1p n=1 Tax=Trichomonascus vanleenenianus TaxID=2268995 RepID=UPI003ECAFB0E